jgi:hypothetical protein
MSQESSYSQVVHCRCYPNRTVNRRKLRTVCIRPADTAETVRIGEHTINVGHFRRTQTIETNEPFPSCPLVIKAPAEHRARGDRTRVKLVRRYCSYSAVREYACNVLDFFWTVAIRGCGVSKLTTVRSIPSRTPIRSLRRTHDRFPKSHLGYVGICELLQWTAPWWPQASRRCRRLPSGRPSYHPQQYSDPLEIAQELYPPAICSASKPS